MTNACWAAVHHSIHQNPLHTFCPEGAESWCRFNKALALAPPTSSHPAGISRSNMDPVWQSLTDPKLLVRCLARCHPKPKREFQCSRLGPGTKDQVRDFHHHTECGQHVCHRIQHGDRKALILMMDRLDIQAGPLCKASLVAQYAIRIKRSQAKEGVVAKKRRRSKQIQAAKM